MDSDIREALREVGKNINDSGRMAASKKSTISSLETVSEALRLSADTIDTYIRTQKLRDGFQTRRVNG